MNEIMLIGVSFLFDVMLMFLMFMWRLKITFPVFQDGYISFV